MLNNLELIRQIHSHKKRVAAFASAVWGEESNVTKLMRWHDIEKYILLPFMLWHKNSTTKEQRGKARAFYNRLNRVGDQIFEIVFAECSAEEKKFLKNIEKVIDVCDRHLDKVVMKEFKLSERRPLSDFLKPEQIEIAKELLTEHSHIWDEIFNERFEALV